MVGVVGSNPIVPTNPLGIGSEVAEQELSQPNLLFKKYSCIIQTLTGT